MSCTCKREGEVNVMTGQPSVMWRQAAIAECQNRGAVDFLRECNWGCAWQERGCIDM
jgi:hypothetical protein